MDYNAYNVALKGEPQGDYSNTTLGSYDYWAIEYAYKPIAPAFEEQELRKIAARSIEPLLAFGDDYDAGGMAGYDGTDPLVNRFDLGDDPLAYYEQRLKLARELWQRIQTRGPQPGDDPTRARRVMLSGFGQVRARPTGRPSTWAGWCMCATCRARERGRTTRRWIRPSSARRCSS